MSVVKSRIKSIYVVPMLAIMMCAYGPCDPTSCPTEATMDPVQGCWFEFTPQQPTVSVNAGELQIGLQKGLIPNKTPRYRFAFIKDPQETVVRKQGRVGTWKLLIRTWAKQETQSLKLSWTLREQHPTLRKQETLRLALSWLQHGKRRIRILPGHYNSTTNRLHAMLPTKALYHSRTYLFPVRYQPSTKVKNEHTISKSSWAEQPCNSPEIKQNSS